MAHHRRHCGRESGQSYVETVVMLPVLLALFLGLYYFHALVQTRMRAIEAARYVTWEGIWHVREDRPNRTMKDDGRLAEELRRIGLGTGLLEVRGGADGPHRRSLNKYTSDVSGASFTSEPPQFIVDLFPGGGSVAAFAGQVDGFLNALGPLFSVAGDVAFFAHDFFALQTLWQGEVDGVYTAKVVYRFKGAGFFQSLPGVQIVEFSSLLTHPLNVRRTDDRREYDAMFGSSELFQCFGSDPGRVYPLWLFPTGPLANNDIANTLSAIQGFGKCFLQTIGSVLSIADIIGTQLAFKLPDGTLKEFPERPL